MTTRRSDSHSDDSPHSQDDACGSRGRHARHRGHRARKERVLHTRISEQLAEDIRHFAEDLRVPASNLVRNVLEEVFTMVDSVSDDVGGLMDDLIDEAEGVRDRVRSQADSRSPGRGGRQRRRSRRRRAAGAADVEDELRRDEAAEAKTEASERAQRTRRDPGDAPQSEAEEAAPQPQRARAADLFPHILGWQPLVLNRDFACGLCERDLPAGESAFLGIGTSGLTETALCGRCASSSASGRD